MLGEHHRRCTTIDPTFGQCLICWVVLVQVATHQNYQVHRSTVTSPVILLLLKLFQFDNN